MKSKRLNLYSQQGDSGGPIVENIDGSWVLIGLTSFGLGCGKIPMTPGQMTKVSNFIPYIEGCEYLEYFLPISR